MEGKLSYFHREIKPCMKHTSMEIQEVFTYKISCVLNQVLHLTAYTPSLNEHLKIDFSQKDNKL
jgi:hypothetical protein